MRKTNYLNNKDILKEIHKSKSSFCSFVDPDYNQFDIILDSLDKINIRTIAEAKRNKAKRLGDADYAARKEAGEKVKQADCAIDYKKITKEEARREAYLVKTAYSQFFTYLQGREDFKDKELKTLLFVFGPLEIFKVVKRVFLGSMDDKIVRCSVFTPW